MKKNGKHEIKSSDQKVENKSQEEIALNKNELSKLNMLMSLMMVNQILKSILKKKRGNQKTIQTHQRK